ncbi:MAG: DUF308 domain-containing protein [Solobacterium sp.]|nr:DUF308 domain-containing protein [Solobacterium sp.]
MLKQIKWSAIGLGAGEIAAGILLVMYPALSSDVICYLIGVGACIFGLICLVRYFLMKLEDSLFSNDFVIGVMALLFGMIVMIKKDLIIGLIPIVLGMIIVFSGFMKLQRAVAAFRIRFENAVWYACLGFVSIIVGFVIMFLLSPSQTQDLIFRVIGGGLIYCGISDLVTIFFLASRFNRYVGDFKAGKIDITVKPEPEPEPQPAPEPVFEPEPEPAVFENPEPVQQDIAEEPLPYTEPEEIQLVLPEEENKQNEEIQLILPDEEPEEAEEPVESE